MMSVSPPLQVFGFWRSIASFRVRVALNLKGLAFTEVPVDILNGAQFSAEYDRLNPEHVLPTLVHGETVLFQSMPIMEYVEDLQPTPPLLPKTPADRAYARALALVAVADSHPLIVPRVRKQLAAAFGAREPAVNDWCGHWTREGLQTLETLLARRAPSPFAVGDTPGLADICIVSQAVAAGFFGIDLAPFAAVARLHDTCLALPPFAQSHPLRQPGAPAA
jgi:maleylacetoacetate isomerase